MQFKGGGALIKGDHVGECEGGTYMGGCGFIRGKIKEDHNITTTSDKLKH